MSLLTKVYQFCAKYSAMAKYEITHVKKLPSDVAYAARVGKRRAKIDNKSIFETVGVTTSSVVNRGIKTHLPGLFAGIGFCSPLPLGSVAGFGIGKVLQRVI